MSTEGLPKKSATMELLYTLIKSHQSYLSCKPHSCFNASMVEDTGASYHRMDQDGCGLYQSMGACGLQDTHRIVWMKKSLPEKTATVLHTVVLCCHQPHTTHVLLTPVLRVCQTYVDVDGMDVVGVLSPQDNTRPVSCREVTTTTTTTSTTTTTTRYVRRVSCVTSSGSDGMIYIT